MDFLFFIDVILTFNTAILDDNTWTVVDNYKTIASTYLKTWFVIDVLACFPFGLLNHGDHDSHDESHI
jgi:hypothetical protein